jgi:hypothetical protein
MPDSPFRRHPTMVTVAELEGGDRDVRGRLGLPWHRDFDERRVDPRRRGWTRAGTSGTDNPLAGEVVLDVLGEPPRPTEQPPLAPADCAATLETSRRAVESGEVPEIPRLTLSRTWP